MLKTLAPPPFVAPAPAPVAPSPARAPVAPTPAGAPAAHPFARMLKQNQTPHAEPPAPKAEPPAQGGGDPVEPDTEPTDASGAPARADARGRARSGRTDERSTPRTPQVVSKDGDKTTPIGDGTSSESDEAKPPTTADPAFAGWLAERPAMPDAIARDVRAASAEIAAEPQGASGAEANRARPVAQPLDASRAADAKRTEPDTPADGKAFTELMAQHVAIEPAGLTLAAERAAAAQHAETPSTRLESIAGTPAFSAAAFVPAAAASLAAPVEVRLATPLGAPDFAQTLGTQVSVLAGNGVQRAELHLNPAEMGPVSVQIVVEGGQARVDFGADHAATRQAIENGLPELASALRDAGLTLTGGGVSQHARGRGDRGAEAGPNPGRGQRARADAAEPITAARARSVAIGGVDLYA
jgi:flagellar hook-length control protein FliK